MIPVNHSSTTKTDAKHNKLSTPGSNSKCYTFTLCSEKSKPHICFPSDDGYI